MHDLNISRIKGKFNVLHMLTAVHKININISVVDSLYFEYLNEKH